jgi:hypothetical protein
MIFLERVSNTGFIEIVKNSTYKEIPHVLNMRRDVTVQMGLKRGTE